MDILTHLIRDTVPNGHVSRRDVNSEDKKEEKFTKQLNTTKFLIFRSMVCVTVLREGVETRILVTCIFIFTRRQ